MALMRRFDHTRLKQARLDAGFKQFQLERIADTWPGAIGYWERGDHRPGLDSFVRIADELGKPLDYFFVNDLTPEEAEAQEVADRLSAA